MIIGKWHMGTHPALRPLARGFDEFYGFLSGGHNYMPEDIHLDDISQSKKVGDWYHARLRLNDGYHDLQQYLTDELSDRAVDFVNRHKDVPFFLYLAYNAPHTPLQATEKYLARYAHIEDKDRRIYAAMIGAVDDGVGRVLGTLDELGLADDTLVIFLSDNGGRLPRNKGEPAEADNSPLRGGKGQLFEGGIRVPFAMRWPGVIPPGMDYNQAVISLDILATISASLNLPLNPEKPLDGANLVPFLKGEKTGEPHEALYWRHFKRGEAAVVSAQQKFLSTGEGAHLYDLENDIGETANRARQESATVNHLRAAHELWNAQMAKEAAFDTRTSWPPKAKNLQQEIKE
jgi:arylsulfatase A-like enzyme